MEPLGHDHGPGEPGGGRLTGALAALLGAAALAILAALVTGAGAALFGILAALFPVVLIALALAGQRRLRRNAAALTVLGALLVGSTLAMLVLRGAGPDGPRLAGLPLSLAVLFGGIWLVPLVLTGLAHALTFDDGSRTAARPTSSPRAHRQVTPGAGEEPPPHARVSGGGRGR